MWSTRYISHFSNWANWDYLWVSISHMCDILIFDRIETLFDLENDRRRPGKSKSCTSTKGESEILDKVLQVKKRIITGNLLKNSQKPAELIVWFCSFLWRLVATDGYSSTAALLLVLCRHFSSQCKWSEAELSRADWHSGRGCCGHVRCKKWSVG